MSEFLWQECSKITKDFIEDKLAVFFVNPIDDEFILSEYRAKIKKPMDLSTVFKKIKDNSYIGIQDWVDDIYLIFDNAIQFNGSDSLIGGIAAYFKKKFDKKVNILQLKNSRNLEDQLIKLQIKMLKLWSKQPPELLNEDENKAEEGDQTNQEIHVNEDIELLRDFDYARIETLQHNLNDIVKSGNESQIIQCLNEADPFVKYEEKEQQIDVAKLGRHSLLVLEEFVKKLS